MPSYDDIFERNIGVFSSDQQKLLKKCCVGIVGCGGLGGPVAYILTRLGVGCLKLADPDIFEVSNLNRQFGAYVDTVGKSKVDSIAAELLRINPGLKVEKYPNGINQSNIDNFLQGLDVVVDGLDFFMLKADIMLHKECRKRAIWILTSQAAEEIQTFTAFDPNGEDVFDLYDVSKGNIVSYIKLLFPVLPKRATPEMLNSLNFGKDVHISSHACPPPIGGAIVAEQFLSLIVRHQKVVTYPKILVLNLSELSFVER